MIELVTRGRSPWSIFDELESLQMDMNRVLGGDGAPYRWRRGERAYPPMNVWSTADGLVLDVEIPGVDPKDVDISVVGDVLTLTGKLNPGGGEGEVYLRRERASGEFTRTVKLPHRVDTGAVKAAYKNGVLRLSLPRIQEEKPRRIVVES